MQSIAFPLGPGSRIGRIALLSGALLLATAGPAAADYYQAVTAYETGSYAAARDQLEPLVADGDPRAQLLLGRMYAAGQGVLQDYVRAHVLYNLAAAQNMKGAAEAREKLAGVMTAGQIAEAQRQAAAQVSLSAVAPASGDPAMASAPAAAAEEPPLPRQDITDLQWHLALHGYDPGPADGRPGPRTIAAIRHYQADAGLPVDGRPTQALLDHLQFTVPAVRNAAAVPAATPRRVASSPAAPGPLDTADAGLRRIYVAGIQEALRARGYDPGVVDGIAGPRTRGAIRRYQSAVGLPADGQPSPDLLNHLKYVGGQVAAR